jgi:electron transfer flavoprotein beta subunit
VDIIVPIKQVPETSNVKMDPVTGTMIRDGVGTVVNPLDLYAIETALRLKEAHGGTVTVVTMGPSPAVKALREAIAMGCDDGVRLRPRLRRRRQLGDLVHARAGDRAARPLRPDRLRRARHRRRHRPGRPRHRRLARPAARHLRRREVKRPDGDPAAPAAARVERLVEEGYQILELPLPALLTVVKEIAAPRLPTLRGKKRAKATEIPHSTPRTSTRPRLPRPQGLTHQGRQGRHPQGHAQRHRGARRRRDRGRGRRRAAARLPRRARPAPAKEAGMSFVWTLAEQHEGRLKTSPTSSSAAAAPSPTSSTPSSPRC